MNDKATLDKNIRNSNNAKKQFQQLKKDLQYMCECLKSGNVHVNDAATQLASSYKINDTSGDDGKLKNLSKNVADTCEYILNTIIPSIDVEINKIIRNVKNFENAIENLESIAEGEE